MRSLLKLKNQRIRKDSSTLKEKKPGVSWSCTREKLRFCKTGYVTADTIYTSEITVKKDWRGERGGTGQQNR